MKPAIIELFLEEYGRELDNFIYKNLFNKSYFCDIKQELLLKLCEMHTLKLQRFYQTNGLLPWAKTVILNMFNDPNSEFYKYVKDDNYETLDNITDLPILEESFDKEEKLNKIENYFNTNNRDFFIQLYKYSVINKLSIRKISQDTNLSKYIIKKEFNKIKNKLKSL